MPSFDSSVLSLILEAFSGGTEFILGGGCPSFQLREAVIYVLAEFVR